MIRTNINDLRKLLEPYNPWWKSKEWHEQDYLLKEFYHSKLKCKPRLYDHLRENITARGEYGIITIRGPRRVGKTTIIKLLIKYLIDGEGVDPQAIFYIPLDLESFRSIALSEAMVMIARWDNTDKYVFLDEASMYDRWAQALKNLYDAGLIEDGRMRIVALGSHSMDMAEAASKIRGRQGKLAQRFNTGGNLIYVPLRFSEVVEALRPEIGSLRGKDTRVSPKAI